MNEQNQPDTDKKTSFWELVRYVIVALAIVIPFRVFIAQPYVVSGASMDPTFKNGDYLIVDQLSKRFNEPERGAVYIIRYPKDPSKFFIKRLIAFPREKISIKSGKLTIYNKDNPEGFNIVEPYVVFARNENFEMTLGENEYFVMGDNRAGSSDSRAWGSLPKEYIIGKPVIRLLPLTKLSLWPGTIQDEQN
jgi:signal peptidase I